MTEKQKKRDEQMRQAIDLHKALAIEIARKYCELNGLSKEKLLKQYFFDGTESLIFAQPSDVEPDGLKNDMETMPRPTLVIKHKDGEVEVNQTEWTKTYLI